LIETAGWEEKEPNLTLLGVDYRPSFQTIAFFVEEPRECGERELTTVEAKQSDSIES
jgi:hypothetical protein